MPHPRLAAAIASILLLPQSTIAFVPLSRQRTCLHNHQICNIRPASTRIRTKTNDLIQDDEPCLTGTNIVSSCNTDDTESTLQGTQSKLSAATNLGKCICGAGSFALPHVFLKEGVLGGALALTVCAFLATTTMQSVNNSRSYLEQLNGDGETPSSYVELAEMSLGESIGNVVFGLTMAASLGVCSTYIAFIGQTLASLSMDGESNNVIHLLFPSVSEKSWEVYTALAVFPLSLVRNYGVFAFTSALGVAAVLGGILVTLAYGIAVDPGGGILDATTAVGTLRMWPESIGDAFGGSFGTIAYLFCVNFLTFPIINSMKDPGRDYNDSVGYAVAVVWIVNLVFAIVCLGFYGDNTQDLVLQNLDNGPYLSALKVLLCVDLLFTFPVVFSSGRQILENALLKEESDMNNSTSVDASMGLTLSRAALTVGAVSTCYGLSQVGGFGVVANLVGGVAQGTLAFIIPPAMDIALSRKRMGGFDAENELRQWVVCVFGVAVVSSVTYFTLNESLL